MSSTLRHDSHWLHRLHHPSPHGGVPNFMTDDETIAVALTYAAFALVGPFLISMLMRWCESPEAENLMVEIGAALEGVAR